MGEGTTQDERYGLVAKAYGPALDRLAKAYEADPDRRLDLLQDIHVALWRSLGRFDERCALRTWVYRVAHNVGASHIIRQRTHFGPLSTLEEIELPAAEQNPEQSAGDRQALERLMAMVHRLKPPDRQVMLLYLEDVEAAAIAEVTGLSPGAVAVRIHRAKALLARDFPRGGQGD